MTKAERSKDPFHNRVVDKMYDGQSLEPGDMKLYELYNKDTLEKDDPDERIKWAEAPVLCKTNRERCTLTHLRAVQFAKLTNRVVIRWQSSHSKWEGRPLDSENIGKALNDPAFYEYFVYDAVTLLLDTISRRKKLCNGTKGRYHSLILTEEQLIFLKQALKKAKPGDVITLVDPPVGINIKISDGKVVNNKEIDWSSMSLCKSSVVITVQPSKGGQKRISKTLPIPKPTMLCHDSRVTITQHFPLQPGFAITIDKAQGQTLDRVIVALSKRHYELCALNMRMFMLPLAG